MNKYLVKTQDGSEHVLDAVMFSTDSSPFFALRFFGDQGQVVALFLEFAWLKVLPPATAQPPADTSSTDKPALEGE